VRLLARLDKLKFIELAPGNRIRLLSRARSLGCRTDRSSSSSRARRNTSFSTPGSIARAS
jgi:hypothetical protein